MSNGYQRIDVITSVQRRRRFTTEEKIRYVEESRQPGMSVSLVARTHGLLPSLLFRWRNRMAEGGREAVRADDDVVAAAEVRELKKRVRELERVLGKKTMEVEILREALEFTQGKKVTLQLPSRPQDDSR